MGERLRDMPVVVTGASRGIGRAIAEIFAGEGARVLACGRGEDPGELPDTVVWQRADRFQGRSRPSGWRTRKWLRSRGAIDG